MLIFSLTEVIMITLFFLSDLRTDERPRGQVTKFVSGDDMEDDFMTDDINSGDKNKSSDSKDGHAKPKKGPKVVNF